MDNNNSHKDEFKYELKFEHILTSTIVSGFSSGL